MAALPETKTAATSPPLSIEDLVRGTTSEPFLLSHGQPRRQRIWNLGTVYKNTFRNPVDMRQEPFSMETPKEVWSECKSFGDMKNVNTLDEWYDNLTPPVVELAARHYNPENKQWEYTRDTLDYECKPRDADDVCWMTPEASETYQQSRGQFGTINPRYCTNDTDLFTGESPSAIGSERLLGFILPDNSVECVSRNAFLEYLRGDPAATRRGSLLRRTRPASGPSDDTVRVPAKFYRLFGGDEILLPSVETDEPTAGLWQLMQRGASVFRIMRGDTGDQFWYGSAIIPGQVTEDAPLPYILPVTFLNQPGGGSPRLAAAAATVPPSAATLSSPISPLLTTTTTPVTLETPATTTTQH